MIRHSRIRFSLRTMLVVLPLIGILGGIVGRKFVNNVDLEETDSSTLISTFLPDKEHRWHVWDILAARISSGELAAEDAEAAMQVLLELIVVSKSEFGSARDFVWRSVGNRLVSEKKAIALHKAMLPPPRIIMSKFRESTSAYPFTLETRNFYSRRLPYQFVWQIGEITIDGNLVQCQKTFHTSVSRMWTYGERLPVGEHRLKVSVACALVDSADRRYRDSEVPNESDWLHAVTTWDETIVHPFRIRSNSESETEAAVGNAPSD